MNLLENIHRIKEVMGLLTEVSNPYKVEWLEPTQEYFTQELSELLGNPGRFTEKEFFAPENDYNELSEALEIIKKKL